MLLSPKVAEQHPGKKPSLMGRDCKKLADKVELLDADLKHATDLWEALAALVKLVNFTFDAPADIFKKDEATIEKRQTHAEKTKQAALDWGELGTLTHD